MKNFKSPLAIAGVLYLFFGIFMNIRMFVENMWPTYLFFISVLIGIIFLFLNKPTQKLKNYRIWQLIIGISPIIIFYIITVIFNNFVYETSDENKTQKVNSLDVEKTELEKLAQYKNAELTIFYNDFKEKIVEINWNDEPPAKLSGVTFSMSENKNYVILLDSIPEKYRMNLNFDWKMNEVGKSKILDIKIINENE